MAVHDQLRSDGLDRLLEPLAVGVGVLEGCGRPTVGESRHLTACWGVVGKQDVQVATEAQLLVLM